LNIKKDGERSDLEESIINFFSHNRPVIRMHPALLLNNAGIKLKYFVLHYLKEIKDVIILSFSFQLSSLVKEVSLGRGPSARPLIVLLSVITKRKQKRYIASVRGTESARGGGILEIMTRTVIVRNLNTTAPVRRLTTPPCF
jgi:hypothetical protein